MLVSSSLTRGTIHSHSFKEKIMFIKSASISFIRNAMTHAMVEAALNTDLNNKLEKCIADTFIKQRPNKVNDWTALITTRKSINQVKALMA